MSADKYLIALGCLLITACSDSSYSPDSHYSTVAATVKGPFGYSDDVRVVHDDKHAVTCWVMHGGYNSSSPGISCLPDKDIKHD